EAWDLERVLSAIVEPTNTRLIRAALTTDLVGVTANELAHLDEDDSEWEGWLAAFQDFGTIWAQTGFVHMCRELLSRYGLQERLLGLGDGERRMTNLLQLIELLHEAGVRGHLGPSGVVQFLLQQRRGDLIGMEAESAQIRLESDADAVKITTMHRSKGLEYPVVYCPYLWHGTLLHRNDELAPKLHTEAGELVLDLGSDEREAHLERARWEAFAENLRLAYVALTRARHRCTLVWGRVQRGYLTSPLGYLLHPPPASAEPPDVPTIQAHLQALDDAALLGGLDRHSESAPIRRRLALDSPGAVPRPEPGGTGALIGPRTVQRAIFDRFRVSSFSALTSHGPTPSGEDLGRDHDARALVPPPAEVAPGPSLRLTDFPRGAKAGSFFHDVLEHYDFQSPRPGALGDLVAARLADYHYPVELWRDPVCEHLYAVLDTPLATAAGTRSLRLADIPQSSRLAELEFCVPVGGRTDPRDGRALRAQELARVFREHPSPELPGEYADAVGRLGFVPLRGFLRGYIDLVLLHDDRYFLVDYKANHLGDHASDYAPDGLGRAMLRGQYFLQYHLYALALHRYLGQRLRGYDFERHFGGVYYLFIKGMGPELGQSGVFFEKPPLARLDSLSRLLEQAT
ncbi:MAG TPA: 3'-5' exonuclease, partial [Polyangiaceae bacterium]|nr:3'-5' exonuclease [Polyangiaceae bacterium]